MSPTAREKLVLGVSLALSLLLQPGRVLLPFLVSPDLTSWKSTGRYFGATLCPGGRRCLAGAWDSAPLQGCHGSCSLLPPGDVVFDVWVPGPAPPIAWQGVISQSCGAVTVSPSVMNKCLVEISVLLLLRLSASMDSVVQ